MTDARVLLGSVPLEDARVLLIALHRALASGVFASESNYARCLALREKVQSAILRAEKTTEPVETGPLMAGDPRA